MSVSQEALKSIEETKTKYLRMLTALYFIAGFFWTFSSVGSTVLFKEKARAPETFILSMLVLMASNGVWEILTGWYADKFRRRISMSGGFFFCFLGFVIMVFAPFVADQPEKTILLREPKFFIWATGVAVWSLGPALLSGALEAWLVDRCNFLSANPPEKLDDVFKKAAKRGVIFKALGSLICFFVLFLFIVANGPGDPSGLAFLLCGGPAAILSFGFFFYSLKAKEEYWTDPKYQSDESLFAFLWESLKDLWKVPYRWFTLAFIGATTLNYVLSFTIWPYLKDEPTLRILGNDRIVGAAALAIVVIELAAGFISGYFSRRIDRINEPRWRMPAASLMYLAPVIPLYSAYLFSRSASTFLLVLIAATFFFRTAHASVFGTLNAVGQRAIQSDERRAVLLSMSSALAAFFVAGVLLIVNNYSRDSVSESIEVSWLYLTLPGILMLAVGGYLVSRKKGA